MFLFVLKYKTYDCKMGSFVYNIIMKDENIYFTAEEKSEKNHSNWEKFWNGIDLLASKNGISVSMLAKKGGLDPTIFNKSKRISQSGRLRWPTTESISKVLNVTDTSMVDFVKLMHDKNNHDSINLPYTKYSSIENIEVNIDDSISCGITDMSYIFEVDTSKYLPYLYKNQKIIANKNVLPRINQVSLIKTINNDIYIGKIIMVDPLSIVVESFEANIEDTVITIERPDIKFIDNFVWKMF